MSDLVIKLLILLVIKTILWLISANWCFKKNILLVNSISNQMLIVWSTLWRYEHHYTSLYTLHTSHLTPKPCCAPYTPNISPWTPDNATCTHYTTQYPLKPWQGTWEGVTWLEGPEWWGWRRRGWRTLHQGSLGKEGDGSIDNSHRNGQVGVYRGWREDACPTLSTLLQPTDQSRLQQVGVQPGLLVTHCVVDQFDWIRPSEGSCF